METDDQLEYNQKQLKGLQLFREIVQLDNFNDDIEKIQLKIKDLRGERKQLLQTQDQLIQKLNNIKEDVKKASLEEASKQAKLDMVRKLSNSQGDFLENICLILGYQISKSHMLEHNKMQETLLYGNSANITINMLEKLYELVSVYPQYPEFEKIRQFLQNSQDLKSILESLKHFFDTKSKGSGCEESQVKHI